jgi:outer membrane receptor for ferrienterochelin and colicins
MNIKNITLVIILLSIQNITFAQKIKTDANIIGHVTCKGKHLPFVNISIKGTTIGTLCDETGHFQLINVPLGELTIVSNIMGYKSEEKTIKSEKDKTIEIKFDLNEDIHNLDEVVVSGNRSEQKRIESPVIINTISPKLFSSTQSVTLSEGLCFSPGLRVENNCQNCGFNQVRMNGMEGPYSQILINSRPIFSGLAGVYGLELIPANIIEKVEVVRGGGSALYGSNAIAGTINIILKDPVINSYEIGTNYSITGFQIPGIKGNTSDISGNFNTSIVSDDRKTGITVYGFTRERKLFDANNDGFSEISPMSNLTLGTRFYHRFGYRDKLSVDFFKIKEERDGGNKQDYPLHERDVAEAVKHDMNTAAITFEKYFRDYDLLSIYASGQLLKRDSYYGAGFSLSDYGCTTDKTYNMGIQYKAQFNNSTLIAGIENAGSFLTDKKLGYADYENAVIINDSINEVPHTENTIIADQSSVTYAAFAQFDIKLNRIKITAGSRYDHYQIFDNAKENNILKSGNVFSPRLSIMCQVIPQLQARINYSQGFRAPQIFDEDLHIETSKARQVINVNSPDLKQETSYSTSVSLDYNGNIGNIYSGLLIEGFYTRLLNPFVNEYGTPDEEGKVIYTRVNADNGATVKGVNFEFKMKPHRKISLTSGFTIQSSMYDEEQEFNERHFFRTPDKYGYFSLDYTIVKNITFSSTGNYTGNMLIPYFGVNTSSESGELRKSNDFFDLSFKISHSIKLNGAYFQWYAGVKNILNSYQNDFDTGAERDPSYIYGPINPRSIYFGIKILNLIN